MRTEPEKPSEGAPEWMVSYADMITIMMAFFVVMYALSGKKDESVMQPVLTSLKQQFGPRWPFANLIPSTYFTRHAAAPKIDQGKGRQVLIGGTHPQQDDDPRHNRALRVRDGLVRGGVVFFEPFAIDLNELQQAQLRRVATEVSGKPQRIEVRGHSSPRALPAGSPYRDDWDLAYERCRSVLEFLGSQGVDRHHIRISVSGSNEPLARGSNDQPARGPARVEVYMLNEFVSDLPGAP